MNLSITLISDIICPWCYVGKKRLETAIQELNLEGEVVLDISPYQLYPDTPLEGRSLKSFGKKGHKSTLTAAGEQIGISFRWDLIQNVPNTLDMHQRLMHIPAAEHRWEAKGSLLEGYFCAGSDLTNEENVRALLLPFENKVEHDSVAVGHGTIFQEAINRNITAVPSFILDGEHHITGAMEKQQWVQFLKRRFQVN
ncbi:MAG: putative DsbA family dithiol-disulfide isomerase [Saprospiraceae bacterium]